MHKKILLENHCFLKTDLITMMIVKFFNYWGGIMKLKNKISLFCTLFLSLAAHFTFSSEGGSLVEGPSASLGQTALAVGKSILSKSTDLVRNEPVAAAGAVVATGLAIAGIGVAAQGRRTASRAIKQQNASLATLKTDLERQIQEQEAIIKMAIQPIIAQAVAAQSLDSEAKFNDRLQAIENSLAGFKTDAETSQRLQATVDLHQRVLAGATDCDPSGELLYRIIFCALDRTGGLKKEASEQPTIFCNTIKQIYQGVSSNLNTKMDELTKQEQTFEEFLRDKIVKLEFAIARLDQSKKDKQPPKK
jgi:hypothetical protein